MWLFVGTLWFWDRVIHLYSSNAWLWCLPSPPNPGGGGWRRFNTKSFLSRDESTDGTGFGFCTSSVCFDGFVIHLNRDVVKSAFRPYVSLVGVAQMARYCRWSMRDDRCISRQNRLRVYGTGRHVNHQVVGDCRVVFAEHAWLSTRERAKRATDRRTFRINYGKRNRVMVICFTLQCFFFTYNITTIFIWFFLRTQHVPNWVMLRRETHIFLSRTFRCT